MPIWGDKSVGNITNISVPATGKVKITFSQLIFAYNGLTTQMAHMLSVLDGEEKQCLILRLYAKMPYKEIADILRISVASAQKKYQRSVRKLKDFYL